MSGSICVFKKPGGGENVHSVLKIFFCANDNIKAKLSKVIGKEGALSFDVGPGFKNKCAIVYIEHAEYIK